MNTIHKDDFQEKSYKLRFKNMASNNALADAGQRVLENNNQSLGFLQMR